MQEQSTNLLGWALKYYDQGFPVFPAKYHSKSPAIDWKDYQIKRAPKDDIITWFSNSNNYYNVAIVLGKISRGLEIDIDGYEGKQRFNKIVLQL